MYLKYFFKMEMSLVILSLTVQDVIKKFSVNVVIVVLMSFWIFAIIITTISSNYIFLISLYT